MQIDDELNRFIDRSVRQECAFTPDPFNLKNEVILKELESLLGIIILRHHFNNIRCAKFNLIMTEIERKLQEFRDKVVKKSQKNGLAINCKKTESMVVSKIRKKNWRYRNQTSLYD